LLQRGKGAEVGAMFGGGASGTVFGGRGAGNFLTRLTTGAAVVFMLTSLTLAYFGQQAVDSDLFQNAPTEESAPSEFEESPASAPTSPFEEVGGEEEAAGSVD
ncbi:MAG: preprotein translocase subunit SecG, partial [Myxococcota bacterium]